MKKITMLFLLLAGACTQKYQVYTTADNDYDVRLFSHYQWEPMPNIEAGKNPLYYNEMNDKYLRAAVDKNLGERNFQRVEQGGELLLHYHIVERSMVINREDPYFYHRAPWMGPQTVYEDYTEGTLIIDIMEAKTNTLVWRGLASGVFNSAEPYLSRKTIDAAVEQIFKEFPTAFF